MRALVRCGSRFTLSAATVLHGAGWAIFCKFFFSETDSENAADAEIVGLPVH